MAQMQLIQDVLTKADVVYTPDWCARDMVEWFNPTGKILEPCKGSEAILKYMPTADWCEVKEGRDFFAYNEQVNWIITNPPFSMFKAFLSHGLSISENVVYLIAIRKFFTGMPTVRIARDEGWIKHIRIYGAGSRLGFPIGNPVGAIHWQRGYSGDTSWSWYAT